MARYKQTERQPAKGGIAERLYGGRHPKEPPQEGPRRLLRTLNKRKLNVLTIESDDDDDGDDDDGDVDDSNNAAIDDGRGEVETKRLKFELLKDEPSEEHDIYAADSLPSEHKITTDTAHPKRQLHRSSQSQSLDVNSSTGTLSGSPTLSSQHAQANARMMIVDSPGPPQAAYVSEQTSGVAKSTDPEHHSILIRALKHSDGSGEPGDLVAVVLTPEEPPLLMNKAALVRTSGWFATKCANPLPCDSGLRHGTEIEYKRVKHGFALLGDVEKNNLLELVQVRIHCGIDRLRDYAPPHAIKTEDDDTDAAMPANTSQRRDSSTLLHNAREAYKGLFQILELIPPGLVRFIDEDSSRVKSTLLANAVTLAARLEALPALRRHMSGFLYKKLGQRRWAAIKDDPPLWLNMSLSLQDVEIYKEAAIHIIGRNLSWLPSWTVPKSSIPDAVLCMLERKADQLTLKIYRAIQALNALTMYTPSHDYPGGLERVTHIHDQHLWLINSIWHEWWRASCSNCVLPYYSPPHLPPTTNDQRGMHYDPHRLTPLFRVLAAGGESYLPSHATVESIRTCLSPAIADHALYVLADLKTRAARIARGVLRNELQARAEGAGLMYFTCVELGSGDVPFDDDEDEEGGDGVRG